MQVLVVFAKDPSPGRSKSRLARTIGEQAASQLARAMLVDTVETARAFDPDAIRVSIAAADREPSTTAALSELAEGISREPQVGDTLGERLANGFRQWFDRGAERVVVIGTDCPLLDASHIESAFEQLSFCDVVLGPAADGGYYLVGLSTPEAAIFDGVDWDGPRVLEQTAAHVRRQRKTLGLLPQLSDLDEAADMPPLFGQLEAMLTARRLRGQATYWTLQSLLDRERRAWETQPAWERVALPELDGVACPCGTARRAFTGAADLPATVHLTEISRESQPHRHARQREVYVILDAGEEAALELDGERVPVAERDAILIRPGCVHRAIGPMTVLVLCVPKFDPGDEEVMSG